MRACVRVRWPLLIAVIALAVGWPGATVAGQEAGLAERGPRFLRPSASAAAPVEIDVGRSAVLRRQVSLNLAQPTVGTLLESIERQTGLKFAYNIDRLPADRPVELEAKRITVAAALTVILLDTGLDVLMSSGNHVVLVERTGGVGYRAGTIVGRVTDTKTGEGLAGADVGLEGTRWRTATGADGRYRLAGVAPGSYTLAVRRIGYARQSRAVTVGDGEEVTVDVALEPQPTQLDEVVTTVTGEQRLRELGHVVGRIDADSLVKEAPVSSLSELLTGRVPGLQVSQTQGTVGGRVKLQVRGPNSLVVNNQPIVIIDGVRHTTAERSTMFQGGPGDLEPSSPLNDLNVNDIESIEVVKGPSAATLYGTDAANGVIVVTTKRGQPGPARWNAYARGTRTEIPTQHFDDIYWGWGTVFGEPNSTTFSCGLFALAEGWCTQQDSITVLPNPLNDPALTIFESKPRWEYGANVAGGRQDLRYYFSGDYEDATGPVRMPTALAEQLKVQRGLSELPEEWREPNAFTKLNLRSNVTAVLGEQADLRVSSGYVRSATRALTRSSNPYVAQFFGRPGSPAYGGGGLDPVQAFARTSTERSDRFFGNASGQWRPTSWLATRATLGLDLGNIQQQALIRPGDAPNDFFAREGAVEDTRARQLATTAELGVTATARRGRLSMRTSAGAQYVRTLYTASGSFGRGLPPGGSVPQVARTIQSGQQYHETAVLGGYLEEMLGLNDRLFVTGALRLDGASTFGRDYEAALYPKVGASWLVSEEPFLPRLPGIDELRLRYAFGAAGKQPNPGAALPTFVAEQMMLNGERVSAVDIATLGNPDLRPERVREHEFGFDAAALGSRVTLDVTWFRRRTVDQIVELPSVPGLGLMSRNLGLTTQRGFEAQLRARVLDTRLLSWDLALQHADHTTRLVELGDGRIAYDVSGGWVEGYPLGARFERPIVGWEDVNGDGIIGFSEVERGDTAVYMGQSTPPRTQTVTTVLGLFERRLRVSAVVERATGFTQINTLRCGVGFTCRAAVDPSTPLAAQVEALSYFGVPPEKADFTRLREVTAAFDLPSSLTRALRLRSATLALSARNLALWTEFSGPDPEVAGVSAFIDPVAGGDAGGIPQSRTFSLRLDVGF